MPPSAWNANFAKLKQFSKEKGHCNVPSMGELRYLAKWITRLKKSPRNITPDRHRQLAEIGFDWSTKKEKEDIAWNQLYQRLVDYKAKNGNCAVRQGYSDDSELGTWVANQRRRAKQGDKLRQDRKELLDKLEFAWEINQIKNPRTEFSAAKYDQQWNTMFETLKKYKAEKGNCLVPYNYSNTNLGMWVSTQRRTHNKKTYMYGEQKEMLQNRKDLLISVGFEFQPAADALLGKSKASGKDISDNGAQEEMIVDVRPGREDADPPSGKPQASDNDNSDTEIFEI